MLSKSGVKIDLDIVEQVLSLKPKPGRGLDFQLYGCHLEKSI